MTKWMNRRRRMSYALLNNNIFIYYKWATKMHCISIWKWISISFQIFSELGIFCTNISTCQRVRTFHEKMTKTTIFTYFLLRKNILTSFIKRDFCLCVKKCPAYGPSSLISFFIFSFSSLLTEAKSGFSLAEKCQSNSPHVPSLYFFGHWQGLCVFSIYKW